MRFALAGLLVAAGAAAAQPLPVLEFAPPPGFSASLGRDPSAHVSRNADAIINVYPFRHLTGQFAEQFRRTLLRELLVPDGQEIRLAGPPEIQALAVPGAEAGMFARFVEDRYGAARYRLRVAVYSAGAVAIVDYNANGPQAYQANWPAIATVLDSLKVGAPQAAAAPPSGPGASAGAEGLYLGTTRRFMPRIGGPVGSGDWLVATRFYLLSPDGRFHRGYNLPSVPGGDLRRFDYAGAEREDPGNTGTFALEGRRVVFRSRSGDTAQGELAGGELKAENMTFRKAALKN